MEMIKLSNGVEMPIEGYGVFQIPDANECKKAVLNAIKTGYRLIDTAALYMNEEAVGEAVKEAISAGLVKREELFITTKLWWNDASYEGAKKAFEVSRNKLGLDYIDLYLIHQPYGDVYGAWRAMEQMYEEGRIRAIGVANFYRDKFEEFTTIVNIKPMINQIELHPFYAQKAAIEEMKAYGCIPQAWGPLAEGKHEIFNNPILTQIGKKYGKTAAQIALKWNAQRGVSIIPKSVHVERMEENLAIWDFRLSDEDIKEIDALTLDHSEIIDHRMPEVVKYIMSVRTQE